MFPKLSTHDLEQRYKNSWIQVSYRGKPTVVFVSAINSERIVTTQGVFYSEETEIIHEFPQMGLVNFQGYVHILHRKPIRQWCRGFQYELIYDFCRAANPFHYGVTEASVSAMFNRVWIPLNQGLPQLKEETISSFAINNKYWFSGNKQHQYVWRNKVCIGELLFGQIFFFKESSVLQEEVKTDLKELYAPC